MSIRIEKIGKQKPKHTPKTVYEKVAVFVKLVSIKKTTFPKVNKIIVKKTVKVF